MFGFTPLWGFSCFQFVDGQEYLADLVGFALPFAVLNIDAGIAGPGGLEDGVARASLPGLAKVLDAHLEQVSEAHVSRCAPHGFENLLRSRHLDYGTTIGTMIGKDDSGFIRYAFLRLRAKFGLAEGLDGRDTGAG